MNRHDYALGAGIALAAVLAVAGVSAGLSKTALPDQPRQVFRVVPGTQPTGVPHVRPPIDKTKLIIQQNPDCWWPIPGFTCDPGTRTYL